MESLNVSVEDSQVVCRLVRKDLERSDLEYERSRGATPSARALQNVHSGAVKRKRSGRKVRRANGGGHGPTRLCKRPQRSPLLDDQMGHGLALTAAAMHYPSEVKSSLPEAPLTPSMSGHQPKRQDLPIHQFDILGLRVSTGKGFRLSATVMMIPRAPSSAPACCTRFRSRAKVEAKVQSPECGML